MIDEEMGAREETERHEINGRDGKMGAIERLERRIRL